MSGGEAIPIVEAAAVATEFISYLLLTESVDKIRVAGSIRRGKPEVHDIEIVCIPRQHYITTLTEGEEPVKGDGRTVFEETMQVMLEKGLINRDRPRKDTKQNPFGPKYYRINYLAGPYGGQQAKWYPVDLFTATPENWGLIYLLRTGSGDFNRWFVQQGYRYGVKIKDGRVEVDGVPADTPEEIDVFSLLRVPFRDPSKRESGGA